MMQVNELRIGNLTKQGKIVRIRENSVRVEYLFEGILKQSYVDYINLDAIPLTEEILLKCGFTNTGEYLSFYNGYFCLIWNDEHISIQVEGQWLTLEIKYFHQLQNLYFALTGKELTYNSIV